MRLHTLVSVLRTVVVFITVGLTCFVTVRVAVSLFTVSLICFSVSGVFGAGFVRDGRGRGAIGAVIGLGFAVVVFGEVAEADFCGGAPTGV